MPTMLYSLTPHVSGYNTVCITVSAIQKAYQGGGDHFCCPSVLGPGQGEEESPSRRSWPGPSSARRWGPTGAPAPTG